MRPDIEAIESRVANDYLGVAMDEVYGDVYEDVITLLAYIKELEAELAKPKLTASVYPDFVPDAKWVKDRGQDAPGEDGE